MKMAKLATVLAVAILLVSSAAGLVRAADAALPDPAAFLADLIQNGNLRTTGTGELFCWHASGQAETFLSAYEAYQDPRWLEAAEKYYDFYLGKLQKDPDGYEGWIGDPDSAGGVKLSTDALVGDAILCAPLARFVEIVNRDPTLNKKFGATAKRYLDLVTRIMWEKWNHRNCYYQDAAGWGSYHTYDKLVDLKANKWVDAPSNEVSDNLNKHYAASLVLLRLWRATGNEQYKDRVVRICGRAKTMWRYYPAEDRIVWNYWMPHGPYDLEGRAPKSWVAVHPDRSGYQAWEVSMFVEVYDSGLVFEQADLERMIRTNHWMAEGPGGKWRNADGTSPAGELWSGLARFDPAIRAKYEAQLAKGGIENQIAAAWFKYVTVKAPGWQRLYVSDPSKVQVAKVPLQPGQNLTMTVVIPDVVNVAGKERVQFATQTRQAGKLKIELLDAAGKNVLGTLAEIDTDKDLQYNAPFWDGTNPKTGKKDLGEYRVRWTLGDESRTAAVWVKQGTVTKRDGPEALKPGEKITIDFEGPMDKRWKLESAATSTEQAHGGKQSLQVSGTAQLRFGKSDDLPVKVTMWIYDDGAKHGATAANGAAWGVIPTVGDKFCAYEVWRSYLDGDGQYVWVNTGENQWFNLHPSGVTRKSGWVEWVFDFTDPKNVKVTGNGQPVKSLVAKFTPSGAIGIYLLGGSSAPLYVDDITIDYAKK